MDDGTENKDRGNIMKEKTTRDLDSSQDAERCPLMADGEDVSKKSVDALARSFAVMSNALEEEGQGSKSKPDKTKEQLGKDILESLADSKLKMLTFKVKSSPQQPSDVKREIEDYQLRKGNLHHIPPGLFPNFH